MACHNLVKSASRERLYSRVIHSLKNDDEPESPSDEAVEDLVTEKIEMVLTGKLEQMRQDIVSQFESSLSQYLNKRLTELDAKQADAMAHMKQEQETLIAETVTCAVETEVRKRAVSEHPHETKAMLSKVRSITDAPSRQHGGTQQIDHVIWPLLKSGMIVRAIAAKAEVSPATVGRSRQRWEVSRKNVSDETDESAAAEV